MTNATFTLQFALGVVLLCLTVLCICFAVMYLKTLRGAKQYAEKAEKQIRALSLAYCDYLNRYHICVRNSNREIARLKQLLSPSIDTQIRVYEVDEDEEEEYSDAHQ